MKLFEITKVNCGDVSGYEVSALFYPTPLGRYASYEEAERSACKFLDIFKLAVEIAKSSK